MKTKVNVLAEECERNVHFYALMKVLANRQRQKGMSIEHLCRKCNCSAPSVEPILRLIAEYKLGIIRTTTTGARRIHWERHVGDLAKDVVKQISGAMGERLSPRLSRSKLVPPLRTSAIQKLLLGLSAELGVPTERISLTIVG